MIPLHAARDTDMPLTVKHHSNMKTALFAGSFNPFTIGHADIAARALDMFDKLVIAVGCNMAKGSADDPATRIAHIQEIFKDRPQVSVAAYSGLTVDFARSVGADLLIRGVRDVKDFEYERQMADLNLRISGIDTLLLLARPEYASISSSAVRELRAFGHNVSQFLP